MNDLRLADDVIKAAEYISLQEDTDVEVTTGDGAVSIYIQGRDRSPAWLATAMPQTQPGQPASDLDLTPRKVRLGHWHGEMEKFIESRSLSVEAFLDLYKLAVQNASHH